MAFDKQWASLWSWAASCACATALAEPTAFRSFRVLDPEALAPDGEALRHGRVFRLAWQRFAVFKLVPWGEEVQRQPESPQAHMAHKVTEDSLHMEAPRLMSM